jgi:hypothetical protein
MLLVMEVIGLRDCLLSKCMTCIQYDLLRQNNTSMTYYDALHHLLTDFVVNIHVNVKWRLHRWSRVLDSD